MRPRRYGGVSNALSGVCTNPADVLKVRMQMHKGKDGAPVSAISMVRSILKAEGPAAFLSGWQASVMREMSYSAIRMGLYDEIKEVLAGV
jgi:dicarboxylate transporter 10